ncbi:MAG: carboxypeptidase-like regulatory domain-containing protein [Anaerolineae bacterium]|jgi:hypothetical protein
MRIRLVVLISIALLWALAACSLSQFGPERAALVTVAPTRTLKPTYTATTTGTPTYTPSPTPTPSNTPTATPPPTNTPVPTDTPSPTLSPTASNTPTITPMPTDTTRPTPRPTRRPTNTPVPRPTNTPAPPFSGTIVRGYPHCGGYAGVTGHVKHGSGSAYPGVAVGVWSNTWLGAVAVSDAEGKYDIPLTNVPVGQYLVAVVDLGSCPQQGGLPTASGCTRLSKPVEFTITEDCNVSRVTEVDFTGP